MTAPRPGSEKIVENSTAARRTKTRWEFMVAGRTPMRLDQFLTSQNTGLTRSRLQGLIAEGQVTHNGGPAKAAQRVRQGDRIILNVPPPRPLDVVPQEMPLTLVFQDDQLIVVDKPAGLSVHPGPGHPDRTLVNALLARCPDIQGIGGVLRPGIVHRLDKDTSGLMMVAKTDIAHQSLSAQIKDRQVTKGYLALAVGRIVPAGGGEGGLPAGVGGWELPGGKGGWGLIEGDIARDPRHRKRMAVVPGGKPARTRYRALERLAEHTLVEVYLETGRTHQIRVHLAHLGHPLFGDGVYGRKSPRLDRHFLHAHHLGFRHPVTGEPMEFHSPLPPELSEVVEQLRGSGESPPGR